MARFAAIATMIIGGIIVADILTHPQGVSAASSGFVGAERPALNALLGKSS